MKVRIEKCTKGLRVMNALKCEVSVIYLVMSLNNAYTYWLHKYPKRSQQNIKNSWLQTWQYAAKPLKFSEAFQ